MDNRHTTKRGTIERKHRNTKLETLRRTYPNLLPGRRGSILLGTLLEEYRVDSLKALLRELGII